MSMYRVDDLLAQPFGLFSRPTGTGPLFREWVRFTFRSPIVDSMGMTIRDRGHFDTDAPWIVWWFRTTDRMTRITGRSRVLVGCAICGARKNVTIKIPRVGKVPAPEGGKHPKRQAFIDEHAHPTLRNDPRSWAQPFLNPSVFGSGIPLDMFENIMRTAEMEVREAAIEKEHE